MFSRGLSRGFPCNLCFHPLTASFPVSSLLRCCVQGSRGGYDFRSRRQQPRHRVGAGGSALRLQPKVQQAGQRCVSHALRPDLPETIPVGPLDRQICSGFHTILSLCHYSLLNIQPIYLCPTIGWILKISGLMLFFSAYPFVSQSILVLLLSESSRRDCRNKPWSTSSIFPALKWFSLTSHPWYSIFWCFLRLI